MDTIKILGAFGFWFFFIKGLFWLLLFGATYYGFVDKTKIKLIKDKLSIMRKKRE